MQLAFSYLPWQVGKVESCPLVQVTSELPLSVKPLSQVTVYLLPEAIVAVVGATEPSEIVGLLQGFAEIDGGATDINKFSKQTKHVCTLTM